MWGDINWSWEKSKLTKTLDSTFPAVYFLVILVWENFMFNMFSTENKNYVKTVSNWEQKRGVRNINVSLSITKHIQVWNHFSCLTKPAGKQFSVANYKCYLEWLNIVRKMNISSSLIWTINWNLHVPQFITFLSCNCDSRPGILFSSTKRNCELS